MYMISILQDKISLIKIIEDATLGIRVGNILKPSGEKYAKASTANYGRTTYWLKNYETHREKIYLEDIDPERIEDFMLFLMQENVSKNSVANMASAVKKVVKTIYNQGLCGFNNPCSYIEKELTTKVYNTEEELELLLNLDLNQYQSLQLVRDVYLLQCCIGLRFGDLKKVLVNIKNHISEEGSNLYFKIKPQNAEKEVVIPLSNIAKDILVRNNYTFKNELDYSLYNSAIKAIAGKAGINDEIIISYTQGARIANTVRKKSSLMNSHTAQKSFATNTYLKGIDILDIIPITGHSTPLSFLKYIRCSFKKAPTKIVRHPFSDTSLKNAA